MNVVNLTPAREYRLIGTCVRCPNAIYYCGRGAKPKYCASCATYLKLRHSTATSITKADVKLASSTGIAIKRTCLNPNCREPFVARLEAALYCGLDCYINNRHFSKWKR